jgi:hypothetical protein
MHTNLSTLFSRRTLSLLGFGAACVFGSFLIGVKSAGEVHTFGRSEAQQANLVRQEIVVTGDVDGNGTVDASDALRVLEIVQGERPASDQAIQADPDGDGRITTADALLILRSVLER